MDNNLDYAKPRFFSKTTAGLLVLLMTAVVFTAPLAGCYENTPSDDSSSASSLADDMSEDNGEDNSAGSDDALLGDDGSGDDAGSNPGDTSGGAGNTGSGGSGTANTGSRGSNNGGIGSTGGNSGIGSTTGGNSGSSGGQTPAATYSNFKDFSAYGKKILNRVDKDFWRTGSIMQEKLVSVNTATLWPYTSYVEACGEEYAANKNDAAAKNRYRNALDKLEMYRSDVGGMQAYQSAISGGDRYYDDNVWVALEFYNAYKLLGGSAWLESAKNVAEFVYSGRDTNMGGGIYWKENDKTEKAACSTAPTAYLYALLYETAKQSKYLDRATELYSWVKTKLINSSGLVKNGISNPVRDQDNWIFAYNTGNMIAAGAVLYRVTGQAVYANEALAFAKASYGYFGKSVEESKGSCYLFNTQPAEDPWILTSLLKGYMELYQVKPSATTASYVQSFGTALAYGCYNIEDDRGYFSINWKTSTVGKSNESKDVELRHQCASARALFMLQRWSDSYK